MDSWSKLKHIIVTDQEYLAQDKASIFYKPGTAMNESNICEIMLMIEYLNN